MSASIPQSIEALCKERGIDRELVIEAMKEAVRAAARKQFRSGEDIQVEWSAEDGLVIFATKEVVEEVTNPAKELSLDEARELAGDEVEVGDELQLPMPLEEMGRIAAQTAKQILTQKVRDAERANIYEQYIDKVGDLVNGYVKRFERGDLIVDLGNVEAILPRSQQSRTEQWAQGERIRVVIEDVHKESKGPQVVVSRTSPELLRRLFEMEVPEIYDETVVIKSAVREPGERAKIAVASNERDVDPVGACVGMKGSRVQAIIRELRGEKIDIIEWSDEPSVFAANALSPAKVNQVRITDIERRQMEVIVNEDQLSLAIGKRGQNVRLATKLVGWNIDIRSEEDVKREVALQMGALIASGGTVPLEALGGITPQTTASLAEHGINDIDTLAATSVDDLVDILDISLDEAEGIISSAQAVVDARDASKGTEGEDAGAGDASADGEATDAEEVAESLVEATSEAGNGREGNVAGEDTDQTVGHRAASIEPDENGEGGQLRPSDASTNQGYDEAVQGSSPFRAEDEHLAEESVEPVAMTEIEPMSADELLLQEPGRDLRPDTITPAPDLTSSEAAVLDTSGALVEGDRSTEDTAFTDEADSPISPVAALGGEASAPETPAASSYASENAEESAIPDASAVDVEKPDDDASGNATE